MDCEKKNTISPEHTVYAPGYKYMINHVFVYAKTPRRGEACKKSKILSNQNHYKLLPQNQITTPKPPFPELYFTNKYYPNHTYNYFELYTVLNIRFQRLP